MQRAFKFCLLPLLVAGLGTAAASLDPTTQKIVDDMKREALIQEIGEQMGLFAQQGLAVMYRVDIKSMTESDRGITEDIFATMGACMVRDLEKDH